MPEVPTVCAAARSNPKDRKQASEPQKIARGFRSMAPTRDVTNPCASSYTRRLRLPCGIVQAQVFAHAGDPATRCEDASRLVERPGRSGTPDQGDEQHSDQHVGVGHKFGQRRCRNPRTVILTGSGGRRDSSEVELTVLSSQFPCRVALYFPHGTSARAVRDLAGNYVSCVEGISVPVLFLACSLPRCCSRWTSRDRRAV